MPKIMGAPLENSSLAFNILVHSLITYDLWAYASAALMLNLTIRCNLYLVNFYWKGFSAISLEIEENASLSTSPAVSC